MDPPVCLSEEAGVELFWEPQVDAGHVDVVELGLGLVLQRESAGLHGFGLLLEAAVLGSVEADDLLYPRAGDHEIK